MEEVEQLCTNIAIIDKGRVIAKGTKEDLKAMISVGEKITMEVYNFNEEISSELRKLPGIYSVNYRDNLLEIKSGKGKNNLVRIIDFMENKNIHFGRVITEQPSLNDVFLEITGKELRD
jgi:ABC-2 type transport system ATP-binding protein